MQIINIYEAKTKLSQLIERVSSGEEIIIAKAGKPVARLLRFETNDSPRVPGIWKGRVTIAEDFDRLPESIAAPFRGENP